MASVRLFAFLRHPLPPASMSGARRACGLLPCFTRRPCLVTQFSAFCGGTSILIPATHACTHAWRGRRLMVPTCSLPGEPLLSLSFPLWPHPGALSFLCSARLRAPFPGKGSQRLHPEPGVHTPDSSCFRAKPADQARNHSSLLCLSQPTSLGTLCFACSPCARERSLPCA